jgi:adenosylmethionine-8-amino-7-oxononanoate aminotransferase
VLLRPLGNVVVLMPPLAMTPAQLERLAGAVRSGVDAVTARL